MAESFPFSVSKLDRILKYFSIEPTSTTARDMKGTLAACEEESNEGETRYCATSLESMVDFAISLLKTNDVRLLSMSILDNGTAAKGRIYTVHKDFRLRRIIPVFFITVLYSSTSFVTMGVTEFPYKDSVVCHVLGYPYAVFYCHKTINTSSYVVPLVAEEDGSRVDAGAVCHTETSSWNPKHATFQTLGVKPGVPICHFLPYGHFAWVANSGLTPTSLVHSLSVVYFCCVSFRGLLMCLCHEHVIALSECKEQRWERFYMIARVLMYVQNVMENFSLPYFS
ncbi:hypothetical protein EJ110_NYTH16049 [Nymphaea thermarum]|nr:hypothetical protein EJ110_NYTH16049 [Nymphaea thermarum]